MDGPYAINARAGIEFPDLISNTIPPPNDIPLVKLRFRHVRALARHLHMALAIQDVTYHNGLG